MTTARTIEANALAAEFSRILRSWMTDEEWAETNRLNREEAHPSVCHSHDFHDANMAMLEAWGTVHGIDSLADDFDLDSLIQDEAANALMDEAWRIALPHGPYSKA